MGQTKQAMSPTPFAIVTGAGSGIGYAFAKELARRKINLVLVSLPNENLQAKSESFRREFGIQAIYFEADLSDEDQIKNFHQFVVDRGISIGYLINNAGIGSVGAFDSFSPEFYSRQIRVNNVAPVLITRYFLPILKQCNSGYILYVSSLGSFFNIPNKEVYCASKNFLYSFATSLRDSLRDSEISVSVVCPGPVDTNERLIKAHKSMKGLARKAVMSPDEVASFTIRTWLNRQKLIVPGRLNRMSLLLNRLLPHPVKRFMFQKEMKRQAALASENG
ncbi:MAG: hypothetical protein C5B52_09055 [Bacteroidetes bacterium]|nr:MAG: hypothetical protein C5B52_09055 [Bacteroidota bacterium]